jgi:hypothetical protein
MATREDAPDEEPAPAEHAEALDAEQLARRRLLQLTAYVAPAIIGTLLISRDALAAAPSCGPSSCAPNCAPRSGCAPQACKPRS